MIQVRMIDVESGLVEWSGSLADFVSANPDMLSEASALERGESVDVGGGAAPWMRVEVVS